MNSERSEKFSYVLSCKLNIPLSVKISTLEGFKTAGVKNNQHTASNTSSPALDFFVTCKLFGGDEAKPLLIPLKTSYKSFKTQCNWNEWLVFPIQYRDLPRNARLCFTIWQITSPRNVQPLGGTTLEIFRKYGVARTGKHKLVLYQGVEADGSFNSTTDGKTGCPSSELDRLEKILRRFEKGLIEKCDWLDKIIFRQIEKINAQEKIQETGTFLFVELPQFDCTVVYHEQVLKGLEADPHSMWIHTYDEEAWKENLVETKHRQLTRSHRRGALDRDLKPNAWNRDLLQKILSYPPTKLLSGEEKDLLWKFRFYLSNNKKGLTKFLKCVDWSNRLETSQAIELLISWQAVDVDDALELLSGTFTNAIVRSYAVSRLRKADDDEILSYLLQLVQALRYDRKAPSTVTSAPVISPASSECEKNVSLSKIPSSEILDVHDSLSMQFASTQLSPSAVDHSSSSSEPHQEYLKSTSNTNPAKMNSFPKKPDQKLDTSASSLSEFLIYRAIKNQTFCNFFYWYLMVECQNPRESIRSMYIRIHRCFIQALGCTSEGIAMRDALERQAELVGKLCSIAEKLKTSKESRLKKVAILRDMLSDEGSLFKMEPTPLPLDPNITIVGILPENSRIFKSSLMPMGITFRTSDAIHNEYSTLFKTGDDLRQDQLVIQIISLMDRLLLKENLDLKLTPYHVIATGTDHGFVQFVKAKPVALVLEQFSTIQAFFRDCFPANDCPYGITTDVMETYVRSCAGYCVITYLLGVGDRHLDNLLLSSAGNLFHIDFGYILGRDPKPFPPPMKISKEMVEAMGGTSSPEYKKFLSYGYNAFLILRKNANLILNLFSLMIDANIPDIAAEPEKAVLKVQDKFHLHLTDEEAVNLYIALVNESVGALFSQMVEHIHRWAQYWRK